mgnify:CR=1 FL=1
MINNDLLLRDDRLDHIADGDHTDRPAVLDDRLYVVERTGVAIIDLDQGEIVDRRLIESAGGFLNDLAVKNAETR